MDSTGRRMYRLRAEVAGRPRKTPAHYNCSTDENGGLTRHVPQPTPAELKGRTEQGFIRDLGCGSGLSYLRQRPDHLERQVEVCQRTEQRESLATHVDVCIETSRDGGSIPPASTRQERRVA